MVDASDRAGSQPTAAWGGGLIAGKYVVERPLGAGGMGMVLAGRHAVLGSPVAIKVLLPAASAIPGATERFVREARAAAALRSEHVARVMDVGLTEDGTPYLVMELLSGQDLRGVLRERGRLPVEDVAAWIFQTCDAMGEAHRLGIIHRDLKPGNLFLTQRPNGTPLLKVLDFGLAKVLDGSTSSSPTDASLTATGLVIGSPPYMPPEQLRSLKLADARSDIWSLGVILFELLTGEKPFKAERPEGLIVTIATDAPPSPRSLRADIPEAIEALILRCLRKAPDERPQSVHEIATVLDPFAHARPAAPRSSSALLAADRASVSGSSPVVHASGAGLPPMPPRRSATDTTVVVDAVTAPRAEPSAPRPLGAIPGATAARGGDTTTLSLGTGTIAAARAGRSRTSAVAWIAGLAAGALLIGGLLVGMLVRDSRPQDRAEATPQQVVEPLPQQVVEPLPSAAATASPASAAAAASSTPAVVPVPPTASSGMSSAGGGQPVPPAPKSTGVFPRGGSSDPSSVPRSPSPGAAAGAAKPKPNNSATKSRPEELNSWP